MDEGYVSIKIPRSLHRELKLEAARRGVTLIAVILEAMNSRVFITMHGSDEKAQSHQP